MPCRDLAKLEPAFREKVEDILEAMLAADIPVTVLETWRSVEDHEKNVRNGTSWVKRSKHCDGLAVDIGITRYLDLPGWNPGGADWQFLGELARAAGLTWGGDWKRKDMVHIEARDAQ